MGPNHSFRPPRSGSTYIGYESFYDSRERSYSLQADSKEAPADAHDGMRGWLEHINARGTRSSRPPSRAHTPSNVLFFILFARTPLGVHRSCIAVFGPIACPRSRVECHGRKHKHTRACKLSLVGLKFWDISIRLVEHLACRVSCVCISHILDACKSMIFQSEYREQDHRPLKFELECARKFHENNIANLQSFAQQTPYIPPVLTFRPVRGSRCLLLSL
jgi:hypothetical protein